MKIAVVADDLTGANDCGVQLVKFNLDVSVMIESSSQSTLSNQEIVIYNSDSRALHAEEAYERVKSITEQLIKINKPEIIYKKIDSTMRGNIGSELNALMDTFPADFVFIAPSYPDQGRQMIQGIHHVHGIKLDETEFAKDPKTPVTESYIPTLVERQSGRETGLLSMQDLQLGTQHVQAKLLQWKHKGIRYIVCDSITEEDLNEIVKQGMIWSGQIIWTGSAGLMNHLAKTIRFQHHAPSTKMPTHEAKLFYVVGSVSGAGRNQLHHLLTHTNVVPVEMNSVDVVSGASEMSNERSRIRKAIKEAFEKYNQVAFYSSADVEKAQEVGKQNGLSAVDVSERVSTVLGEEAATVLQNESVNAAFLTGGDTAYAVMRQMGASIFHLIDELEPGVPIGRTNNYSDLFVITKAGNFGTDEVMEKALKFFKGERV